MEKSLILLFVCMTTSFLSCSQSVNEKRGLVGPFEPIYIQKERPVLPDSTIKRLYKDLVLDGRDAHGKILGGNVLGNIQPDTVLVYKSTPQVDLELHIFLPPGHVSEKKTPAIIFFFGGGWVRGTPLHFYEYADYFASRGMVAISAEYRTREYHKTTPFECVMDAKSAIRWIRQHADEWGIDPDKVVASGGSAGGHIAACAAIFDEFEEPGEDSRISSKPNALVLFSPVLDTSPQGYGSAKLVGRETDISPCHHIKEGLPPTITFYGSADSVAPFENATRFHDLMGKAGNHSEMVIAKDGKHGFFNGPILDPRNDGEFFQKSLYHADDFLRRLGYLKGKPTIKVDRP